MAHGLQNHCFEPSPNVIVAPWERQINEAPNHSPNITLFDGARQR